MKRALAIGALGGLCAVLALAVVQPLRADALPSPEVVTKSVLARPASELVLGLKLNGELTKLGVLASTGTTVNNSTTGTTFTITPTDCPSRVILWDCNGAGHIRNGTTCSSDITNANYGVYAAAHDLKQMVLQDSTTLICLDTDATTVSCAVFCSN